MDSIDIKQIAHHDRKQKVTGYLEELREGNSLILFSDGDPFPLLKMIVDGGPERYSWEYSVREPDNWQVVITKTAGVLDRFIGDLVADDFRLSAVFADLGIDFCCGGNRTLYQVCRDHSLDPDEIKQRFAEIRKEPTGIQEDFRNWAPGFLADYICHVYHKYIRDALPVLKQYSKKVRSAHGQDHPELEKIDEMLIYFSAELLAHIQKEEEVIFPYVWYLSAAEKKLSVSGQKYRKEGLLRWHVEMEDEHRIAGDALKRIRILSHEHRPPQDACPAFMFFYAKLREFEKYLYQHVHLENNVLFPRMIKIENELKEGLDKQLKV